MDTPSNNAGQDLCCELEVLARRFVTFAEDKPRALDLLAISVGAILDGEDILDVVECLEHLLDRSGVTAH